jgi:hypothetical protein
MALNPNDLTKRPKDPEGRARFNAKKPAPGPVDGRPKEPHTTAERRTPAEDTRDIQRTPAKRVKG